MSGGQIWHSSDSNDRADLIIDDDPISRKLFVQIGTGKRQVWRWAEVDYADLDNLIEALDRVRWNR